MINLVEKQNNIFDRLKQQVNSQILYKMQSYYDEHLQQRKSSLSSLSRTKRQVSRNFDSIRNQQNLLNRQLLNQYLKPQQKSTSKTNINDNMSTLKGQQRTSSVKKNNPRLRDQQSSDYIRNLYKKYLGKENKQPVDKLSAYTERKLRTTESKQLIATNTTAKDMTRRTLFADNQNMQTPNYNYTKKQTIKTPQLLPSNITLMKKDKNRMSNAVYKQNQPNQNTYQKSAYLENTKSIFQSNKKDSTKKQDKQNYQKQCESKKSNKNYKSKSKIQKTQPEQQVKPNVIKRSQSTHLRSQKSNPLFQSSRKPLRQRGFQASMNHTQTSKVKDKKFSQNPYILHPHRQSYCQFDTQQQIQNNSTNYQANIMSKNYHVLNEKRQSTAAQSRSSQNIQNQQYQPCNNGEIYSRYINDLQTLGMVVGKQSSLFQTLQKINKVKNKSKVTNMNRQMNKLYQQSSVHKQNRVSHRLILR